MKIGTRTTIQGKAYEVITVRAGGSLILRPVKQARASNGMGFVFGERVQVHKGGEVLDAVVFSLNPLQARITTMGEYSNVVVPGWRLRRNARTE